MALLGIDLGGTKLASAIFNETGEILHKQILALNNRKGKEVGELIVAQIHAFIEAGATDDMQVSSIGICVPGIYRIKTGSVWAPNIPGWDDYPLLDEIKKISGNIPVSIDSDRACYILGELWKGNAKQCKDAIFLSVGTGIGAGILINGNVLRGAHDIAGAIGWMALDKPFKPEYIYSGCFESNASGEGIAKLARKFLKEQNNYSGELNNISANEITSRHVFTAYENKDSIAMKVMDRCIEYWGMAIANLVSLFNPEKIILGGGVFGPALNFIPAIIKEASKWAQPISITQVSIEASGLGNDAGIYGAGFLALQNNNSSIS
ncbi:MAG TPA: ROK family protein [Hanamia sp.]|nr:ROK family protein [Hanamia sp.]